MTGATTLDVAFDELTRAPGLDLHCAWPESAAARDLGTIGRQTPQARVAAAGLVRSGVVVNLSLPLDAVDPPLFGRKPLEHSTFMIDRNNADDLVDNLYLQGSSHWDGLRHVRARELGYFGGVTEDPRPGGGPLGIEHWVEHGIVGRGVLLDLDRYRREAGEPFDPFEPVAFGPEDLDAVARAQGVALEPGDVLLLRFGWMARYLSLDADGRRALGEQLPPRCAGLAGGEDMARFIWDRQVSAIAVDNLTLEVSPGDPAAGSLHRRLIPMLGLAFGELFTLDRLAGECAARSRFEFLFVAVPLNLPGAVGSPANAIAVL